MKAGTNQSKMGENSFLESFAQILFIRDVNGGGNSPRPHNGAIPQHPEILHGLI